MIKYLGSKRKLVGRIARAAGALPVTTACDLFTGTTRVAQALRAQGLVVHANDTATYAEVLAQAFVVATPADHAAAAPHLAALELLPGRPGYFTRAFCEQARYLRPENGARVDAIRDAIDELDVAPVVRGILLTALLLAADRVDSTTGLQMAYLKSWASRSAQPLALRAPEPVAGPPGRATRLDALVLAPQVDAELTYVDPPYNHHSYFSNYHVWETLVRWDAPVTYGVANKRVDCRTRKSPFNAKREAAGALARVLHELPSPWVVVSLGSEGFHDARDVAAVLAERGHVATASVGHERYVGARIGIHDPQGRRVGQVSHVRTTEHLIVCGPDRARVRAAVAAAGR